MAIAAAGVVAADLFADAPVEGGDVVVLLQADAVGRVHHQQHAGRVAGGRVEMEKIGLIDLGDGGQAGDFQVALRRGRGLGVDVGAVDLAAACQACARSILLPVRP